MKRLWPWTLLLALVCACAPGESSVDTPLRVTKITPARQSTLVAQDVRVTISPEPRFQVDYGTGSVRQLDHYVLWLGEQRVPLETYLGHEEWQGTIPAGLDARRYDVRVALEDGREATLVDAYEVRSGSGPALSFYVETIGPQFINEPFTVTLHASDGFEGTVNMTLYKLGSDPGPPTRTGPFTAGVRQEQLTLTTPGQYLVKVEDDEGNSGNSNSFRVDSRN